MNSIELKILTDTIENTSFVKYYNKKESLKIHKITSIYFLLYSWIKNNMIFEKLLKVDNIDFSKVIHVFDRSLEKGDSEIKSTDIFSKIEEYLLKISNII